MKVNKVHQNFEVKSSCTNGTINHYNNNLDYNDSYNPSFQKKPSSSLSDRIIESLRGKKTLLFMRDNLAWMKGEIGGVAMTAIGTGLVAPWPIAFNPFVKAKEGATEEEKEDVKNTKYYTAWRQPISAVLAGIFQIGALTPIDKFLDYLYNTPELAKNFDIDTNQSVINNDGFVKRKMQKEMKKEGLTESSMGKEKYDLELKSRIRAFQDKQLTDLAESMQSTNQIKVGKGFIDNHKVANIVNTQIDDYITDAIKLQVDRQHLIQYMNRAKVLIENEEYLKNIFSNLPEDTQQLQEKLKQLLSKETNPDIKIIIEEILDRSPDIQASRIDRTFQRIAKIKHLCGGEFTPEKYFDRIHARNAELDKIIIELEKCKIKDVGSATTDDIGNAIKRTAEACTFDKKNALQVSILHDAKTFGTQKEKLSQKIYKDIAKGYKKFVQSSYKSHNQIWKIAIGVFITLPITCNALNWVYPRFMKAVFPDLADSKAKQKKAEKEGGAK